MTPMYLRPGVLFAANLIVLVCAIAGFQISGWTDEARTGVQALCALLVVLGAVELVRWKMENRR